MRFPITTFIVSLLLLPFQTNASTEPEHVHTKLQELESPEESQQDWGTLLVETFDVSVSKSDFLGDYSNDYVFTLNGSYNLNDKWRLFGSVDSDKFGDIGLGYSFLLFEQIYNEVSASVGGNTDKTGVYTTGLFSAAQLGDAIVFTNFDVQYIDSRFEGEGWDIRDESFNLNKLVGVLYPVNDVLELSASYGHDSNLYGKAQLNLDELPCSRPICTNRNTTDAGSYINLGFTLNLWGVKPYLSHRFDLNDSSRNYWDFSLSFDY